ncbi:hypothetical protein EI94DRAFT_1587422, partial [Lactarius quietus]
DLDAYNIQIQLEDRATFFGGSNLPLPIIDEEIFTTLEAEDMLSDHNAELIHLLDLAMRPASARETAVNDFTVRLLRQLGYVKCNSIACTQRWFPYLIAGEWGGAIHDIVILDGLPLYRHHILLLIQEVKHFQPEDQCDPSASLIARAIGAFNIKNLQLLSNSKATIKSKVMPGIIMNGTMPTFYKIPLTVDLGTNFSQGTYPSEPTIVSVHVPDLPSPQCHYSECMKPLDNRQAVLSCFEAFKHVIGI